MSEDNERFMRRIQHALALAEDPSTTEEERALALERADAMMAAHKIDRAMLQMQNTARGKSTEIVKVVWDIPRGEFRWDLQRLQSSVARHTGCRTYSTWEHMNVVGHPDDISYGEMLWAVVFREFAAKINPEWTNTRSFGANIMALKDAGWKWVDIAYAANRNGFEGSTTDGGWLKREYKRECIRTGATWTRQTQRHGAYRQSWAEAFCTRISQRLLAMKRSQDEAIVSERDKVLPALANLDRQIDEAFWTFFPDQHPDFIAREAEKRRMEQAEFEREAKAAWDRLTPAQQRAAQEKEERQYQRYLRSLGRHRDVNRPDEAGHRAGTAVANQVDLAMGANKVGGTKGELA